MVAGKTRVIGLKHPTPAIPLQLVTFDDYRQHVEQYSACILSYPSDMYHAFRGIENAFYPDSKVIHGLPEADFSLALLWYPYDLPSLRERRCGNQDTILPSWSWASLDGHIATCCWYGERDSRGRLLGASYYSLCKWNTWDEIHGEQISRNIRSVNDQNVWSQLDVTWSDGIRDKRDQLPHSDSFSGSPDYRQFLAMPWSKGCIETDVPVDLANPESDSVSPRSLESRWPTLNAFSVETEIQRQNHHSADPDGCPKLSPGQLFTRTQWSALYIKHDG